MFSCKLATCRHFASFIGACKKYGRSDLKNISKNGSSLCFCVVVDRWSFVVAVEEHSPDDVKRYYKAFFTRYKEIKDHERHLKTIEKGEEEIERNLEVQKLIARKVSHQP